MAPEREKQDGVPLPSSAWQGKSRVGLVDERRNVLTRNLDEKRTPLGEGGAKGKQRSRFGKRS
jgi:hypothetical protein